MSDLTKIDKPFGELDRVTQWALKGAWADGEAVEYYSTFRGIFWQCSAEPTWVGGTIYRLAPPTPVNGTITHLTGDMYYTLVVTESGTATVDIVDGKRVRIVWEADQ